MRRPLDKAIDRSSRERRRRAGSTATTVVLSLSVLIGFVGLGVDMTNAIGDQARVQAAADTAALAAVTLLPDVVEAEAVGRAYAATFSTSTAVIETTDVTIEVGRWNPTDGFEPSDPVIANTVSVLVTARTPTWFATLFGLNFLDISATAGGSGTWGGQAPDLVVVQDVTGSFSAELPDANAANLALTDCIETFSAPRSKLGYVKFTGFELNALAPDELVTIESGFEDVQHEIRQTGVCGSAGSPACSGTNPAAGIWEAINILNSSASEERVGRAIILLSDGAPNANNTVCAKVSGLYKTPFAAAYCPGWGDAPTDTKLETAAYDLADIAEAAGYDLYTVFYNESIDATQSAFMSGLTTGNGTYLETPNSADLPALMQEVCRVYQLTNPTLVW